jgi:molybdate/tungstate transport system permease protein
VSRPRFDLFALCCHLAGALVLLVVVAPLGGMMLAASGSPLVEAAGDAQVRASILLTLWTSALATLLLALPSIPLAWLLARREFPGKGLVTGLLDLPVVIPHSAAGIALLGVLGRDSLAGQAAEACGFAFVGGRAGIVAAMAFVSLPFLINAARDAFAAVPERLEKAALTLGASPWRAFRTISLPLAWRGVLTGMVMMFARGLSEFGAVIIIAYHPMVAPVMIYERFNAFGLAHARGPTALFVGLCLIVFLVLRLLAGRRHAAL